MPTPLGSLLLSVVVVLVELILVKAIVKIWQRIFAPLLTIKNATLAPKTEPIGEKGDEMLSLNLHIAGIVNNRCHLPAVDVHPHLPAVNPCAHAR